MDNKNVNIKIIESSSLNEMCEGRQGKFALIEQKAKK